MKQIQIFLLCCVLITGFSGTLRAEDLQVTKVIEVGEASWVPYEIPLKFSPDGSKLAYFRGWSLMVSDTLGNNRQICEFDLKPYLYEWLTEDEIIVTVYKHKRASDTRRMVHIDINTGEKEILREYARPPLGQKSVEPSFRGPLKTVEGNLYCRLEEDTRRAATFPQSKYKNHQKTILAEENHILTWGDDGVYKVTTDFSDSTRLGPKPYAHIPLPPTYDNSLSYVIYNGKLLHLSDSMVLDINSYLTYIPQNTKYCGATFPQFNPSANEIIFNQSCYGEDENNKDYDTDIAGLFNIDKKEVTILDTLVNLQACQAPSYAPDGLKIALLSEKKVYIIYRE